VYNIHEETLEKAIIVSVLRKGANQAEVHEHLSELRMLLTTANVAVVGQLTQERERPDFSTAIGKGKLEELLAEVTAHSAHMVVFDHDITPAQVRNLEMVLKVKVLDRSGIILHIFANHAQSIEARTQVELAQLEYLLPRLTRMWTHLSKQFGGVGTKGPGETQIETDRRMFRTRIARLRDKLRTIDTQRVEQRKSRQGIMRFALVGYTNAGKSSLMRQLTGSEVMVEDKLFATLDTTVRQAQLPNGNNVLISDTVGFIRKLPTQLVASFRTTLAETLEADVLLHVVDASSEYVRDHIMVVQKTLAELQADALPQIMVMNKIDQITAPFTIDDLQTEFPGCVFVSALRGLNIQRLLIAMQQAAEQTVLVHRLLVPYNSMDVVSKIYGAVEVLHRSDTDSGVALHVKMAAAKAPFFVQRFAPFIIQAS
jgi:GTPase